MDLFQDVENLWSIPLAAIVAYITLIVCARMVGLRSFSKMSSFDFALTVAMGSVLASTIIAQKPLVAQGVVALVSLFVIQWVTSRLRKRFRPVESIVDNEPLLLMDGEEILHENLSASRVTEDDLRAKLREANVLDLSEVRAVVLETTGDVSVLHSSDEDRTLQPELLKNVQR